jgi:outer membrane protein assembly factor BamB
MTDFLTELREELLDGLERYERAPRRWRPWAWRPRIGPAARRIAAVTAAAAAAIAVGVQVDDRSPELERGTTPQVSRLEGFVAAALTVDDRTMWVVEFDTARLLRIDLATGAVRARIGVPEFPGAVIEARGALWVLDYAGRLLKVDPRTDRVARTIALGQTGGDLAFAAGVVWAVGDDGLLLGIDPDTLEVRRRVELGRAYRRPTGHYRTQTLALAGDVLWVAGPGVVTEIDARSGRILGRAAGPMLPAEYTRRVAADDGGVWISSATRREVLRIDADTRKVTHIPVSGEPGALALVDGRVWVATLHARAPVTRVAVLDADGRTETTMPLPGAAEQIVQASGGGAWVTFGEGGVVSPAAVRLGAPGG